MRRIITLVVASLFTVGLMALPAHGHHDHRLDNPGGCVDIRVGHQDHSGYDEQDGDPQGVGKKFHGGAHVGAATEKDAEGNDRLGQGNSRVTVAGGGCGD